MAGHGGMVRTEDATFRIKTQPPSPFKDPRVSASFNDQRSLQYKTQGLGQLATSALPPGNKRVVVLQGKECKKTTLPVASITACVFGSLPPLFSVNDGHQIHKNTHTGRVSCVPLATDTLTVSVTGVIMEWLFFFWSPSLWCCAQNKHPPLDDSKQIGLKSLLASGWVVTHVVTEHSSHT